MTDLTPTLKDLIKTHTPNPTPSPRPLSPQTADEFLKEAYRINSHITSLLQYLHTIRPSYLSTTHPTHKPSTTHHSHSHTYTHRIKQTTQPDHQTALTPSDRDKIDTSTSTLLRNLSTSITNLSAAESLRQETLSSLLDRQYGRPNTRATKLLFQWAAGGSSLGDSSTNDTGNKSAAQIADEEKGRTVKTVRESILWFLRRRLEGAVSEQRGMVERRIERAREREKSVLYKASTSSTSTSTSISGSASASASASASVEGRGRRGASLSVSLSASASTPVFNSKGQSIETGGPVYGSAKTLDAAEVAAIEAQLSPEQLQLFAEENDSMVRYYEDTLGKVQNAEKSLLEISSLQQTLVSHLSTQEEYISQLVGDVVNTETNIGHGNKELRRATERRSAAQAVFWGTVGLCTWLVVWDLIF